MGYPSCGRCLPLGNLLATPPDEMGLLCLLSWLRQLMSPGCQPPFPYPPQASLIHLSFFCIFIQVLQADVLDGASPR